MSDWKLFKLSELADIIMGQSPKGEDTNYEGVGTPLLNGPTEFTNRYPIPVKYTTDAKKIANIGDLMWCVRGSTVGRRNFANREYAIGRGLASIRSKYGEVHTEFIGILLDNALPKILSSASGSTFPNVSKEQLNNIEFYLPDISFQLKIADILVTLNKKIHLNIKINETIEEMAMMVYRHWLVDFGPFQDKDFVESEIGMIPSGWSVLSSYDIANYINGRAFKTNELVEGKGYPVVKIAELKSGITKSTNYYYGDFDQKHFLQNGDIAFAWSASLGIFLWAKGEAVLNQHIFKVTSNGVLSNSMIYFTLKNLIQEFIDIAAGRATTMGHITKQHLIDKKVVLPPHDVLEILNEKLSSYFEIILSNMIENEQLNHIRDFLLSRLLTGEINLGMVDKALQK